MEFFAENALLAEGWARDVVFKVDGSGLISGVTADARPGAAQRLGSVVVPGMANLHSHAFQRAMAGLAEQRGDSADSFWTWRRTMYGFLDRLTPDDVEAIAALVCSEMLEAGFTTLGEFHYLHHDPAGRPYDDPAEMAGRIVAAAAATGIGLTLLPVFYAHGGFGGLPPAPGQRRFINDIDSFARLMESAGRHIQTTRRPDRYSTPFAPRRDGGGDRRRSCRSRTAARSTSTSPNRPRKSKTASPGAAGGRSNICWTRCRWTPAGAPSMRRT